MHYEFSRVVDPVFAYVLNLLDRLQDPQAPATTAALERDRIKQQLVAAENRLHGKAKESSQWELSKYALIVWIDEVLIHASWDGRSSWEAEPLEHELLGDNKGGEQFYRAANDARRASSFEALEVFYLGVVLGFQGFYAGQGAASRADSLGLPPSLSEWAKDVGPLVGGGNDLEFSRDKRPLGPCDALTSFLWLLAVSMLTTALAVGAVIVAWYEWKR